MKISYLITCSTETTTLENLLNVISTNLIGDDDITILVDRDNFTEETDNIVIKYEEQRRQKILRVYSPLNKDYSKHKNFGIEQCDGDWIFQLDGDEMPPESLIGENLHNLIESNPTVDAYAIPRINAWSGLTEEHAKRWGWGLDMSPTHNRLRAAWPDYQFRLFKNCPEIRFKRPLHERIEGFKNLCILPCEDETYAIDHIKTIEKQEETNLKYNKDFSKELNAGISNE